MSTRIALRGIWDFAIYLGALRRDRVAAFLVDVAFTVVAAVTLWAAANTAADVPALFLLTISVARLGWNLWKLVRAIQDLLRGSAFTLSSLGRLDLPDRRLPVMELRPSALEERHGFRPLATKSGESVFQSIQVDQRFQDGAAEIRFEVSPTKERRLKRYIRDNRDRLAPLLVRKFRESLSGQTFFNESKLCLASDILVDNHTVKYAPCTYFDAVLTNEASSLVLSDGSGDRRVDCTDMFPFELDSDGRARLKSLGLSSCANHIGVSTIGFTRDQHLVIWEQSPRAQQSQGLLAPTGSGSADLADLDETLLPTLAGAMRRELHEESLQNSRDIPLEKVGRTTILGYFRWLRRAGKPEFVGLSELAIDAGDLEPNPAEVRTPGTRIAHCYYVPTVAHLDDCLTRLLALRNLSVPLELNLLALQAALQRPWSRARIKGAIRDAA